MAGLLGGFLAGASKGAVDIAKMEMEKQNAADLAQVNANIAVEREARIRENTRAANAQAAQAAQAAVPADAPDRSRGLIDASLNQGNLEVTSQFAGAANLDRQTEAGKETIAARKDEQAAALEERRRANMSAAELKAQELKDRKELKLQELQDKAEGRADKAAEKKTATYANQTARFNSIRDTIGGPLGGKLDGATGQYMIPPDNAERYALAVSIAQKMERLEPGALSPGELAQTAIDSTDQFLGKKQAKKRAAGEADPGFFAKKPDFGGKTPDQWADDRARELVAASKKRAEAGMAADNTPSALPPGLPPSTTMLPDGTFKLPNGQIVRAKK